MTVVSHIAIETCVPSFVYLYLVNTLSTMESTTFCDFRHILAIFKIFRGDTMESYASN